MSATAEGLLTPKQAGLYLKLSPAYLRKCACSKVVLPGNGPKGKPIIRYRKEDLDAFAAQYLVSEPGMKRAS